MQQRAKAMVLASFAADSLALGAHWIYDTAKIDQQFGRISSLLPPQEGGYHGNKKLGDFTHYGDQSLQLLEYLTTRDGHFDLAEYARDWQKFIAQYQGYMDKATKETLKNLQTGKRPDNCGSRSTDLDGPATISPLIYCYRENLDQLLAAVKAKTAFSHAGPEVLDGAVFLARSCYDILHGAIPREAFQQALVHTAKSPDLHLRLAMALDHPPADTRSQVKEFGQMCAIRAALPGAVYTVLKNEDNLEKGLSETVMAGGDSAARGMAVGMLLGAYHGRKGIPERWLEKLNNYSRISTALDRLP